MSQAPPLFLFEIGKRYPGAVPGAGMLAHMEATPDDDGIELMFLVGLTDISEVELNGLIQEPIRFGILPYGPLVIFLLNASANTFDAPCAIGLASPEWTAAILKSAVEPRRWPSNTRRLTRLAVIDPATRIIQGLREMTLTRDWWITLADALEGSPVRLTREDYEAAVAEAYGRWPLPEDMLPACAIIEEAGI